MNPLLARLVPAAALLVGAASLHAVPAASSAHPGFARGADVGWLSEMESKGVTFRAADGTPRDCLRILQDCGINSTRLRVWVNPAGGWCGREDVVTMARRAKALGFRVMIDFHYSDYWADPGKQNKPAAWRDHPIEQLRVDVAEHTRSVLQALKAADVEPEWVQVGNETNDGMLWPDGRASTHMGDFASLITSGYAAVKSVFPHAQVIVHLSNGFKNDLFRWIFDGLTAHGATYDVIAMSLYPEGNDWAQLNEQCLANMNDLIARYGKPVIIAEVGMEVTEAAACRAFIADLIAKSQAVPDGQALGVFYWEPECHNNWQGYTKGAFADDGRPTVAMKAFKL